MYFAFNCLQSVNKTVEDKLDQYKIKIEVNGRNRKGEREREKYSYVLDLTFFTSEYLICMRHILFSLSSGHKSKI